MNTKRSSTVKSDAPELAVEGPIKLTEVGQMMKNAVNQMNNKLDARVAQVIGDFVL